MTGESVLGAQVPEPPLDGDLTTGILRMRYLLVASMTAALMHNDPMSGVLMTGVHLKVAKLCRLLCDIDEPAPFHRAVRRRRLLPLDAVLRR